LKSRRAKWIPDEWTFRSKAVADEFERHVREQLPWYEIATSAVVHFARHYIPSGGNVYDIGASTGNIGRAIEPILKQRAARFTAIEESAEMAARYRGPATLEIKNALDFSFERFDFAVLFLVLMFLPIGKRGDFMWKLGTLLKPGGAILVVDKIDTPDGYFGTVLRRLAIQWKINNEIPPDEIIAKELSLAGYQRPINPTVLFPTARQFFQFGEFGGWIIEAEGRE